MLEQVARRFKLLGEHVRLQLLKVLYERGESAVQELVQITGHSHANVSKHLRLMLAEGFLSRRQEGVYAYYRIADPTLKALCLLVCGRIQEETADSKNQTE